MHGRQPTFFYKHCIIQLATYGENRKNIAIMKKVFCTLFFLLALIGVNAQTIDETIPRFGETILSMNRTTAKSEITKRGFKALSATELRSLGYDEESIRFLIVGMGNRQITCKIKIDNASHVSSVTIGGIKYLNAKYMISEYEKEGYTLDERNSTRNELIFVKQTSKFNYFAFVEFMVNPNVCVANTEMRRIVK